MAKQDGLWVHSRPIHEEPSLHCESASKKWTLIREEGKYECRKNFFAPDDRTMVCLQHLNWVNALAKISFTWYLVWVGFQWQACTATEKCWKCLSHSGLWCLFYLKVFYLLQGAKGIFFKIFNCACESDQFVCICAFVIDIYCTKRFVNQSSSVGNTCVCVVGVSGSWSLLWSQS